MKRTARTLAALLLTAGLAFPGIASGLAAASGGMTVNGGATGCCRDAM